MVARVEHPLSLVERARGAEVAAVVICGPETAPAVARRLLDEHVCRAVGVLAHDGKSVSLHSRDGETRLVDPSPERLLAAFASTVGGTTGADDA